MPTPCYAKITGSSQGMITKGANTADSVADSFVEGHEDEMLIQEVSHAIVVPTDPQSGQPSGQRHHDSIILTTSLNKSIPLLYNSLTTGEKLQEVVIDWYRTSIIGKQENFFRTTLTNATVTAITLYMPHCQDSRTSEFTQLLNVHINYRKIDWDHLSAGTSGSDDWRAPNEA